MDILILGYSGHAYVVIESIYSMNHNVRGYFDIKEAEHNPFFLKYYGNEKIVEMESYIDKYYLFPSVGSNGVRKKMLEFIESMGFNQLRIIDRTSRVSNLCEIGLSSFVAPGAVINSMASIGKGCIVNSGAIIEHESKISDFSHIGPGAILSGNVYIGEGSFIGINASIKQGVKIGNNVTIGAGSVVLRDIPDNETWVGNPANKLY